MLPVIPASATTALQDANQLLCKPVQHFAPGDVTGRTVRARVVYLGAQELANSIDQFPMRVTLDARDFASRPPQKGDTLMVDDARRAIEQVSESHLGDSLVKYVCGCRG